MITKIGVRMQSAKAFILVLCMFQAVAVEASWNIAKQDNGVTVYKRDTASGHVEVKAVTQVKASATALLALLDDTDIGPKWIANCKKVKTLEWFGRYERTVQSFFNAPWPLSDRDMITYSLARYNKDANILTIDITDKGMEYPRPSHVVRIKHVKGRWSVSPVSKDTVEITYEGYGEPSGNIPAWLANSLIVSATFETFSNMRRFITHPKYQATLPDTAEAEPMP